MNILSNIKIISAPFRIGVDIFALTCCLYVGVTLFVLLTLGISGVSIESFSLIELYNQHLLFISFGTSLAFVLGIRLIDFIMMVVFKAYGSVLIHFDTKQ